MWQGNVPKQTSASNTEQALAESALQVNKEEIMDCYQSPASLPSGISCLVEELKNFKHP